MNSSQMLLMVLKTPLLKNVLKNNSVGGKAGSGAGLRFGTLKYIICFKNITLSEVAWLHEY